MGHQSYVLLCTETTLSNPPVVQLKSSCDVNLLRSPWLYLQSTKPTKYHPIFTQWHTGKCAYLFLWGKNEKILWQLQKFYQNVTLCKIIQELSLFWNFFFKRFEMLKNTQLHNYLVFCRSNCALCFRDKANNRLDFLVTKKSNNKKLKRISILD